MKIAGKTEMNLQDMLLNRCRTQNLTVTVILMNGFQMRGVIRGFDNFVLVLDVDSKQQMVYKHAISTIVPQQRVELCNRETPCMQH